jgi:Lrp/AsnC family transcriptional regulator, leucine-responsive regulatory protein
MTKFATVLELDHFDRGILQIVQANNQLSHAAIGQKVGLSASAVRRRLTAMRASGVIERDVSVLAREAAGITLIVSLNFAYETPAIYAAFDDQMRALPEVTQCYHVAGPIDYILVIAAPSLEWYEDWSKKQFMANEAIARYDTTVVWSCKKFETARPVWPLSR